MSHRCSFTVKRWTDKRRAAHQTKSIVCLHVSFDLPICRRKWHFCPRNVWLRGTKAAAFVSYCSAVITFFVLFFGFFFFDRDSLLELFLCIFPPQNALQRAAVTRREKITGHWAHRTELIFQLTAWFFSSFIHIYMHLMRAYAFDEVYLFISPNV